MTKWFTGTRNFGEVRVCGGCGGKKSHFFQMSVETRKTESSLLCQPFCDRF